MVVIGTSFIGMEVASYLADKASSVECIDIAAVPFERVLGERIGKMLQKVRAGPQEREERRRERDFKPHIVYFVCFFVCIQRCWRERERDRVNHILYILFLWSV